MILHFPSMAVAARQREIDAHLDAQAAAVVRGAFQRALSAVGMKQETAARLMGVSPQQLFQSLSGVGHPSLRRLSRMAFDGDGRRFLAVFGPEWLSAMGVTSTDTLALLLLQIVEEVERRKCRMVKVGVPETQQQERRRA